MSRGSRGLLVNRLEVSRPFKEVIWELDYAPRFGAGDEGRADFYPLLRRPENQAWRTDSGADSLSAPPVPDVSDDERFVFPAPASVAPWAGETGLEPAELAPSENPFETNGPFPTAVSVSLDAQGPSPNAEGYDPFWQRNAVFALADKTLDTGSSFEVSAIEGGTPPADWLLGG
jgi:hypothetical protein